MAEEKLCRKYIIRKTDGSDMPPENRYFVLRYDAAAKHGKLNRATLERWCEWAREYDEDLKFLTEDLMRDINEESRRVCTYE